MLVSYNWICEIAGISVEPQKLADLLTFSGLEVEGVRELGTGMDSIVVGEITAKTKHPKRDTLSIVEVRTGTDQHQVVCGAANCPGPGGRIAIALPGAQVGDQLIEPRELAGVPSSGMICSEEELDIGPEADGILILDRETDAEPGTPIVEALGLRDWILEIGVTPNRPDALSHRGVARETALLLGQPYAPKHLSPVAETESSIENLVTIELLDDAACPRYAAAVIRGVTIMQSPFHVRYRLHNLGIRPISNIVDMTNLILLEYGQPLHAFDLDLLAGAKIVVQKANPLQKMVTLDEVERTLAAEDLLICDGDRPVAIAGVMGGQDTGVTESTQRILIESAYFSPSGIRRTSKRLKLSSESSYRFERGVDPNLGPQALQAAANLTIELAGGEKVSGLIDCYPRPITPQTVPYRPARFNQLMGFDVSPSDTRRILKGLGASVTGSDEKLEVSVPTWRPDIEREVDLIEEVARIRGLSEVPSILPRIRCKVPSRPEYESVKAAKELLAGLGLEEAITYSFVPNDLLQAVGMDKRVVHIANPLNAQRTAMRTTLIAGLLESLKRASSRFLHGIAQFEVAKTFHDEGAQLPTETICASGILSGPTKNWIGEKERSFDFYDVKGVVETFIQEYAGTKPVFKENNDVPCLHPRRACSVFIGDREVGFLGELHPTLLDNQKLPVGALAFELAIDKILAARKTPVVDPMSDYPPMVRDVALLIDENQDAGPVRDALNSHCGSLAKEVNVFDIYRGEGIPFGHKSLAYSIIYQSDERTLTDDEVDKIHQTAVETVLKQFNATQR